MMKRQRGGWEPRPVKQWCADELPTPRAQPLRIADQRAVLCVPVPKQAPKRSEPYRRWVASLPCIHCKREGQSQAAHSDTAKGLSIKADDVTCIPLCADGFARPGCHTLFGSSGMFTQAQRRLLELHYAEKVQAMAKAAGKWPKDWPNQPTKENE